MGHGGHAPQYLDPHYFRSQVKSSCLYSTRRNAEMWILCNVLFVGMVTFNHNVVIVKIRCIFQLILAVDLGELRPLFGEGLGPRLTQSRLG